MRGFRLTRAELLLCAGYAGVSFAVLAALIASGNELTGGENAVAADQLQYLSWIESASRSITIDSLWSIPAQAGSAFLHPGFLGSGLLHRAGLGIIPAYQAWKPVSILLICLAFVLFVRRALPAGGPRTAGLAIALFGLSPAGAILGWNSLARGGTLQSQLEFVAGELFAPSWQWGYMMTAIAVALMLLGLLSAERVLADGASRRIRVGAAALAFLCSWLQPWQGAELIGAVVLCDMLLPGVRGRGAALLRHVPMLAAGVIPLAYYRWLAGSEDVWRIAGEANNGIELWSAPAWILGVGVYVPCLIALRRRPLDWQQAAVRVVPGLMLAQYALIAAFELGTFPFHAIQGMGVFLAVLLVEAMLMVRDRTWWRGHVPVAVMLCAVLCLPGTAHRLNLLRLDIKRSAQPYFLDPGERAVLDALVADQRPGGVLAPIKAALSVPGHTGREVWVGQISWTPNFRERVASAEDLFNGRLSDSAAVELVRGSGARFLYADCGHRADLTGALRGLLASKRQLGCATLYEVRGGRW